MHIVSTVAGTLREDVGAMDALRATLPAGTLSGAPKVRAMQIIDELEPVKRGGYGGAVGYLAYSGDLDTAIHIRTVVVKDGVAHVQAGGGTVADAEPAKEFRESESKAKAVLRALELAGQQRDWPYSRPDGDQAPPLQRHRDPWNSRVLEGPAGTRRGGHRLRGGQASFVPARSPQGVHLADGPAGDPGDRARGWPRRPRGRGRARRADSQRPTGQLEPESAAEGELLRHARLLDQLADDLLEARLDLAVSEPAVLVEGLEGVGDR